MTGDSRGEWAPQKRDALDALANEIRHNYGHGRAIVAVDGHEGAGTAEFADDLVESLQAAGSVAFHASIDNFRQPRARRDGDVYAQGYDYSLLRRVLIDPYRTAGSTGFALKGFDADRDEPVFQPKWKSAGADAILVIDGVFLLRPELSGLWNYSIWLEGPAAEADHETRYQTEVGPRTAATAIYDNSDSDRPQRVFADSC